MTEREASGNLPEQMRWTTQSKEGGSLTVIYHPDDEIADTLGHMGAVRTHLILGTPSDLFKRPTPETAQEVFKHWKDEPWKNHVEIHIGGSPTLEEYTDRLLTAVIAKVGQRLKENHPEVHVDTSILDKNTIAYKIFKTALAYPWVRAKLHRANHYSPGMESGMIFHPKLAVAMHEVGHAQYFDKEPDKALLYHLPGFRSYQEWKASAEAMKRLLPNQERREAMKILEPAWGSYVGRDLQSVMKPFMPEAAKLIPTLTIIAGHMVSRLPFRRNSFGQPLEHIE